MAVAEAVRGECESLGERATDVWRRATRMTQDVGALTTAAKEAIKEGKDAAAKSVESVRRKAGDLRHVPDDVAYRVRHEPLRAMGMAVGVGLIAGCMFGWLMARKTRTAA